MPKRKSHESEQHDDDQFKKTKYNIHHDAKCVDVFVNDMIFHIFEYLDPIQLIGTCSRCVSAMDECFEK